MSESTLAVAQGTLSLRRLRKGGFHQAQSRHEISLILLHGPTVHLVIFHVVVYMMYTVINLFILTQIGVYCFGL